MPVDAALDGNPRFHDDALGAYEFQETTCLPGINGDGVTNVLDLIDLLLCFGQSVPPCGPADVNHDGAVDVLDLIELLFAFGSACP